MKISVIIPTFNRANFLFKTITSIINQTSKVDEIILIDDGSTDNTKQICEKFDIKYIYQKNKGVSSARNKGIKISKNNWIAFCDSDDIWEKNKIEQQMKFHQANKDILISHTNETWKFNNKIIKKKKFQQKTSGFCFLDNIDSCKIGTSTLLVHKLILDDVGYFDESLKACEDYDLWLRILKKYQLGYIEDELITKIAGHKGQLSFETPMMDIYRIKALLKHKNSKFQQEVKKQLLKKLDIVITGAIKHNNLTVKNKYQLILRAL